MDNNTGDVSLNIILETMSKFFDHKDRPSYASLEPFLPQIVHMLDEGKEANVIVQCSKFITYLANGSPQFVKSLLNHGAKKRLMQLLSHKDESVVVSVLRASRYLVPRKEAYTTRDVIISPIKIMKPITSNDEADANDTDQKPRILKFQTPSSAQFSNSMLKKGAVFAPPSNESTSRNQVPKRLKSRQTGALSSISQDFCQDTKDIPQENFMQVMDGIWQCKQCVLRNIKQPNSVWQGASCPPVEYIEKHMRACLECDFSDDEDMDTPTFARLLGLDPRNHTSDADSQHIEMNVNISPVKSLIVHASSLVREEDKVLVTTYVAFVMDQFQSCQYNHSVHGLSGKLRLPDGFPGLECKHCVGTKKARCMFWVSTISLLLVHHYYILKII